MPQGFNNVPPFGDQVQDNAMSNAAGILSTRPQAKYASGARTILRINDKIVGFAFSVSWNISTSFREIEVIDNPLAEELVPRRIQVSGSISALHIPGLGPGVQLWQADVLSFLFHQYITIEVRDSNTGELLFYAPKAVISSRQEDIRVDQLASVSLSFMAIGFRDERSPERPNDIDTNSPAIKTSNSSEVKNIDFATSAKLT